MTILPLSKYNAGCLKKHVKNLPISFSITSIPEREMSNFFFVGTLNAKWFHIFYDKLKANNILSVLTRHDLIKYNRYVSKNKTAG